MRLITLSSFVFLVLLAIATLVAVTTQAFAASCLPTRVMITGLKAAFGEVPRMTGTTSRAPIMLFTNPEQGTFTVIAIGPGQACILLTGKDFEIIDIGDPT